MEKRREKEHLTLNNTKKHQWYIRLRLVSHFLVFATFWRHLWSITEHTHGNMASHCLIILVKFRWTLGWNWGLFMSRLLNQLTQLFPVCTSSLLPQCFEIGVYLQMNDKWIDIGEGLTWQVFQQMWRVLSVAIFPLMMIFTLLVQRKTWSQIYAIRFISVMQACLTITANVVLISWFSRSDKSMKPLPTILSLRP